MTAKRWSPHLVLALLAGLCAPAAWALQRGTTPDGFGYLTGGVGFDERHLMLGARPQYDLWVSTLAAGSGAYLSATHVRVVSEPIGHTVADLPADGPWFMIALPAGRYRVSTTVEGDGLARPETATREVDVAPGAVRRAVFRFDVRVDVGSSTGELRSGPVGTFPQLPPGG